MSRPRSHKTRALRAVGGALLLGLVIGTTPAHADDQQEARVLFERGSAALEAEQLETARDLRRSLDLFPARATAFNLASTLRDTGDVLGAIALYDELSTGIYGDLAEEQLEQVREFRNAAEANVATLEIRILGAPSATVSLDDQPLGTLLSEAVLSRRLNPGVHTVVASAPERTAILRRTELGNGGIGRMLLRFEAPEAELGTLIVVGDAETMLEIVGVGRGRGSLHHAVPPGEYEVRATSREGVRERRANVRAGEMTRLAIDEDPEFGLSAPSSESASSSWLWLAGGAALLAVTSLVLALTLGGSNGSDGATTDPVFGRTGTLRTTF